ncbi:MAG: hypothetical protein JWO32_1362 [Bacteroidetes bacterium]|nr:hypothetical protein [Bacteroidota bacterium]
MKKIILCAGALIFSVAIKAQTPTPTKTIAPTTDRDKTLATPTDRTSVAPPEIVLGKFNTDNPGKNNVIWKAEGNNYWVTYTDPKTNMVNVIVYDKDGKVIRKESEVDKLVYPSGISEYYTKQYPKEKYKVWQTDNDEGKTHYFINRKGKMFWFDQSGKSIPDPGK